VREQPVDLRLEDLLRQAVVGDPVPHHTAEEHLLFEDDRGVPLQPKIVSSGNTGGASAHDSDSLSVFFDLGNESHLLVSDRPVADESFYFPY
jgi:hypothetical protein